MGSESDASTWVHEEHIKVDDIQGITTSKKKRKRYGRLHCQPASSHRFGQYHTGSVHCLKDALKIDPSGDLSDQNWSDPFGSQLLVDAQEIDLYHFLFPKSQEQQLC